MQTGCLAITGFHEFSFYRMNSQHVTLHAQAIRAPYRLTAGGATVCAL